MRVRVNSWEKLAVTSLSASMVTVHVRAVPEQAPLPVHPVKV
jgi:hypothetical protein